MHITGWVRSLVWNGTATWNVLVRNELNSCLSLYSIPFLGFAKDWSNLEIEHNTATWILKADLQPGGALGTHVHSRYADRNWTLEKSAFSQQFFSVLSSCWCYCTKTKLCWTWRNGTDNTRYESWKQSEWPLPGIQLRALSIALGVDALTAKQSSLLKEPLDSSRTLFPRLCQAVF